MYRIQTCCLFVSTLRYVTAKRGEEVGPNTRFDCMNKQRVTQDSLPRRPPNWQWNKLPTHRRGGYESTRNWLGIKWACYNLCGLAPCLAQHSHIEDKIIGTTSMPPKTHERAIIFPRKQEITSWAWCWPNNVLSRWPYSALAGVCGWYSGREYGD